MNEYIGNIIDLFRKEEDLKGETLTFFSPTLVLLTYIDKKIKEENISIENKIQYEQLVEKHIPQIISKYTAIPLTIRTNTVIKDNKTPRELLIEELSIIYKQVESLWDNVLDDDKSNFLAIHRKFNDNGGSQETRQLAGELELEKSPQWDIQQDAEKLLQETKGNWETNFMRPKSELKKKKGITPAHFFLGFLVIAAITVGILILL